MKGLARRLQIAAYMQLSVFNLYVEDFPEPGETLVHNTLSGAYVVLDREAAAVLEKCDRGSPLEEPERQLIDALELADPDMGVVVTSRADEERAYRAWLDGQRARPELSAIVAVNRACNFACTYCCQADVMDGSVMTPDMAHRTADWLAARALEIGAQRVNVTFIGGEPLLHPERIMTLARQLRARLQAHGADTSPGTSPGSASAPAPELAIGLITNGLFLDEDMVSRLLPYGLAFAQVTLDGDEHTHDRSRISKRGEATFGRIFANVMAASRRIRIGLNGNYQDDTIAGFAPLIRKLAAAGFGREHGFSFSPALAVLGAPADSGSGQCTWSRSDHGHGVALHDELVRHGYQPTRLHHIGPCSFHEHHMYVVDVDGTLFKCPGFLGHPAWAIGHVRGGLTERYRALLDLDTSSTCGDCAHRPSCGGGCIANALVRGSRPDAPYEPSLADLHCEFDYLEAAASHGMPREYLLATSASVEQALAAFPAPPVALPAPSPIDQHPAIPNGFPQRGRRSTALHITS
jgi:uncharacterized protein